MSNKFIKVFLIIFTAGLILFPACNIHEIINHFGGSGEGGSNAVYTQTNQAGGNVVLMYSRAANGSLSLKNSYPTQGTGTGIGLGSQGAVELSGNFLLVVNAGSNDITVFAVSGTGLTFKSKTPSGGTMPISVDVHGNLVYVLNAGGSGNITGFKLTHMGMLEPISGSTRNLSNNGTGASPGPAQVAFSPNGKLLVVTEKMSDKIVSYTVNPNGTANGPNVFPSAGKTPFGFEFKNNEQLIVSEAFGGAVDSSAVSSYSINAAGTIAVITGPVFTTETAACWIVITNNGKYTYTTNTGSGTVTGYSISPTGALTILNANGVTGNIGMGTMPIDEALSSNSMFLYVLNSGSGSISSFKVNNDGSLTVLNLVAVTGLPMGTTGLDAK